MAPLSWTTEEQAKYLAGQLAIYISAKNNSKKRPLVRYWTKLDEEFFEKWPEEVALGLPRAGPGVVFSADQLNALGKAIETRKKQLRAYLRYQERLFTAGRSGLHASDGRRKKIFLFKILKKKNKPTRNLQAVEMYQKLNRAKIKEAAMQRGYGDLNEEAAAERLVQAPQPSTVTVLTAEEMRLAEVREEELALARVKDARSERMKLWRATAQELFDDESEEVKREVSESTAEFNKDRATGGEPSEDEEKTPEDLQNGIDQLGGVYTMVHDATIEETGWFGITLLGGPMPRRGGQISTKVICFGKTPNGNTFETSHADFAKFVHDPFVKYLKRSFPHDVRDARALPVPGEAAGGPEFDGLIRMDPEDESAGEAQPVKTIPKRVRRAKPKGSGASHSSAALTVAPSPTMSAPLPASSESPMPTPSPSSNDVSHLPVSPETTSFPGNNETPSSPVHPDTSWSSWGDMPPPTSPRTADAIANFERGGAAAGLENIDPALYGSTIRRPYPVPRPMHSGAAFEQNRPVGGSPDRAPSSSQSAFRPSTLFQAFSTSPRSTQSTSAPFHFGVHPASSFFFPSSPPSLSSPTPPTIPVTTATATSGASSPSIPSPPPTGFRPSALATFTAVVANATAAVTPASAPVPQFIQSRPMANAPKGHPLAKPNTNSVAAPNPLVDGESVDGGDKGPAPLVPRKRGRPRKTPADADGPAVPVMSAEARAETARINAVAAESRAIARNTRAKEKEMEAREKEAKRLQESRRNPDGNYPLFVTASRPKRNAVAKDPDGNPIVNPVKLTRAKQLANRNAPSENALLAATGKRAAPEQATSMNGKKKSRR